jgi:hypothetical protein
MKNYITISILLAGILIVVSLLLDRLMSIFIVCILTCLLIKELDRVRDDYNKNKRIDK